MLSRARVPTEGSGRSQHRSPHSDLGFPSAELPQQRLQGSSLPGQELQGTKHPGTATERLLRPSWGFLRDRSPAMELQVPGVCDWDSPEITEG